MTGESAVTSISDRSTYSLIFFKLGFVPSTRNLRKLVHPSAMIVMRSEEHTSELQSHLNLVCRLLLEKKKNKKKYQVRTTINNDMYILRETRVFIAAVE